MHTSCPAAGPVLSGLEILVADADRAAARLVRRFRLPNHQRDNLRQDLLLDLIARMRSFDPSRGSLQAFARTVFSHRTVRLAGQIRRERLLFAPVSLDEPSSGGEGGTLADSVAEADGYPALLGQPTDRFAEGDCRLDLGRALATLRPSDLDLCADLVDRTPTEISRTGRNARASLYRQIGEIRLRLITAGVFGAA